METIFSLALTCLLLLFAENFTYGLPQISLEYKPIRPSYHPNPGSNTAHTVPPGKPWPANPGDYNSFGQMTTLKPAWATTNRPITTPDVDNRVPGVTASVSTNRPDEKPQISEDYPGYGPFIFPGPFWLAYPDPFDEVNPKPPLSQNQNQATDDCFPEMLTKPQVVILEYLPNLPSIHLNPGDYVDQVIPPGKPWPANSVDHNTFSQTTNSKPNKQTLESRLEITSTSRPDVKPLIVLEYRPNRPPLYPNSGGTVGQIIPPGKPWPANLEDYNTFSQQTTSPKPNKQTLENRIDISSTSKPNERPHIILEYQPNRPSFHPNPGSNVGQIIPPGNPWPANAEDYNTFSQITSARPSQNKEDKTQQTLENRVPETTPAVQTNRPSLGSSVISLEYFPTRPSFHPNPGSNVVQIVPPGKPWPANTEDYNIFRQTTNSGPSTKSFTRTDQNNSNVPEEKSEIPRPLVSQIMEDFSEEPASNLSLSTLQNDLSAVTNQSSIPRPLVAQIMEDFSEEPASNLSLNTQQNDLSAVTNQSSKAAVTNQSSKAAVNSEVKVTQAVSDISKQAAEGPRKDSLKPAAITLQIVENPKEKSEIPRPLVSQIMEDFSDEPASNLSLSAQQNDLSAVTNQSSEAAVNSEVKVTQAVPDISKKADEGPTKDSLKPVPITLQIVENPKDVTPLTLFTSKLLLTEPLTSTPLSLQVESALGG